MLLRPGGKTVVAAGLALTLALVAAGLAWSQPRQGIGGRMPLGISAVGAIRIADSRGEKAILEAPALAPGGSAVGKVTIDNLGVDGRLELSRSHLVETPGAGEGRLGPVLRLRIRDLTDGQGELVYSGLLAAVPTLHLGLLPAGESRRYRFVAALPEPGLVDNRLMGARVRFDYRWHLRRQ
jgi:hypothetical protein